MFNFPKSFKELIYFKFENDKYYDYEESDDDLPFRLFVPIKYESITKNDYMEIPYTLYGDYCGFVTHQSNYRSIKKDFPFVKSLYGDFSSHVLIVKISELLQSEQLKQVIENLIDYPVYDEDDESHLLIELEVQAWDCWVKSDFIRFLEKIKIEIDDESHNIIKIFYDLMEKSNTYFEPEQNDVWIDIERLINFLSREKLLKVINEYKL